MSSKQFREALRTLCVIFLTVIVVTAVVQIIIHFA